MTKSKQINNTSSLIQNFLHAKRSSLLFSNVTILHRVMLEFMVFYMIYYRCEGNNNMLTFWFSLYSPAISEEGPPVYMANIGSTSYFSRSLFTRLFSGSRLTVVEKGIFASWKFFWSSWQKWWLVMVLSTL